MAQSETDICNLALGHLGSGKQIADLNKERSAEANSCRTFYAQARDELLRDTEWPFATKVATLALVTNNPTTEWAFSYQYPSDCWYARRIPSASRTDTRESRIPYRIRYGASGAEIYTDMCSAQLEYTVKVTDPTRFPPDFVQALALRLAAYIAPSLTGGDPYKMRQAALDLFSMSLDIAQSAAFNEEQPDVDPTAESIRARN